MSASSFEEIQLIGSKKIVTQHTAAILPDRQFIYDLCFDPSIITITEQEYTAHL